MGIATEISWCTSTFNIAWGCTKVDPACQHCYAESFSKRTGHNVWGPQASRRTFGEKHWREPLAWNARAIKEKRQWLVFCSSMCDVFDAHPAIQAELPRLWQLIHATPALTWLLLTKRADRIKQSLPPDWGLGWHNVWPGVSIGDQPGIWRAHALREVPATVRFLSCEPLLQRVDFTEVLGMPRGTISWVIAGGESGGRCRPMDLAWARDLRDQAHQAEAAFFMKQLGGHPDKRDRLEDLPPDLRIREFPMPF